VSSDFAEPLDTCRYIWYATSLAKEITFMSLSTALDLTGSIVEMMAIGISLVAFTCALPGTLSRRLGLAAIAGAWIGLASALGAAGQLSFSPDQPIPLVAVLVAAPLLAFGALMLIYPRARAAVLAIPTSLLIGLNTMRALGVLFLALWAVGRLSGPFPFSAGLGDIITGLLAIPLAVNAARSPELPVRAIRLWNAFGALDLVAAIGLGVTSAVGSPVQLIHWGVGSQAMQYLPFCLVPTVLVPFYLVTHAIVAAQLRHARPGAVTHALSGGRAEA
jgi:hypothetical protein